MKHELELLPGSKEHVCWKYFKIILKESSNVIPSRVSYRRWRFLGTEQSMDYSDFIIPGKGKGKRTHYLEAPVGQALGRALHSFIHLFRK